MIVLFTSNKNGGIIQLTHTVAEALSDIGEETVVFCRDDVDIPSGHYKIERYNPIKSPFAKSRTVTSAAKRILLYNPKCVIFTDCSVPAALVLLAIKKRTLCVFSVHDVTPHSGISTRFLNRLKQYIKMISIRKAYHHADKILLYSRTSETAFVTLYPKFSNKTVVMRLGAHLVTTELSKPSELNNVSGYVLFFGRIDGYKGVDYLLEAFQTSPELNSVELIIAGKSVAAFPWLDASGASNIKIINRYIPDAEMNWLFSNCSFVVLPYKDATQSGVIPIAYHYGKPVLVPDIEGLKEYVDVGSTGYVYHSKDEFISLIMQMQKEAESMKKSVFSYSESLSWKNSIKTLLENLA